MIIHRVPNGKSDLRNVSEYQGMALRFIQYFANQLSLLDCQRLILNELSKLQTSKGQAQIGSM